MEGIAIQHMTLFSVFFSTVMSHAVQTILYTVPTRLSSPLSSYLSYKIYTQERLHKALRYSPLDILTCILWRIKCFLVNAIKMRDKSQIKEQPLRCVLCRCSLLLTAFWRIRSNRQNKACHHQWVVQVQSGSIYRLWIAGLFCRVLSDIPRALQTHSWSQKG